MDTFGVSERMNLPVSRVHTLKHKPMVLGACSQLGAVKAAESLADAAGRGRVATGS